METLWHLTFDIWHSTNPHCGKWKHFDIWHSTLWKIETLWHFEDSLGVSGINLPKKLKIIWREQNVFFLYLTKRHKRHDLYHKRIIKGTLLYAIEVLCTHRWLQDQIILDNLVTSWLRRMGNLACRPPSTSTWGRSPSWTWWSWWIWVWLGEGGGEKGLDLWGSSTWDQVRWIPGLESGWQWY